MINPNTVMYAGIGIVVILFLFMVLQYFLLRAKVNRLSKKYKYFMNGEDGGSIELKLSTEDVTFATGQFQLQQILPQQRLLLIEQSETARAQTMDIRTNGAEIVGLLGKQKDLYSQQIISYKRDAENKAAKLFTDAWTVMKTMDEGLLPPTNFTNASLDPILGIIKSNNELI